jgi:2,4-dienoyl-CoA reductase-like NADH-dependent reductase (Old Yellow Enzyme family)
MADPEGIPTEEYLQLYKTLARNDIGVIITGFAYITPEGKAMHPGQAGIYSRFLIPYYRKITDEVHLQCGRIFMQIAHTGRQTLQSVTNEDVVGVSGKSSIYFKEKPRTLTTEEIFSLIDKFGNAAHHAKDSGFDGIQIHAAHGYLLHQFILPSINKRKDEFCIDKNTGIEQKLFNLL